MPFYRILRLCPVVNASAPFCCRAVRSEGVRIPAFQGYLPSDLLFWNIQKEATKHGHSKPNPPIIRFHQKTYLVSALRHPSKCILEKHIKHERSCLSTFPDTEQRVENTTRSEVFVINCGQTLPLVFDTSSQSKLKLKRKRKGKIIKISAY